MFFGPSSALSANREIEEVKLESFGRLDERQDRTEYRGTGDDDLFTKKELSLDEGDENKHCSEDVEAHLSQPCLEQQNLKRRRDSWSGYSDTAKKLKGRKISAADPHSDIEREKKYANLTFEATQVSKTVSLNDVSSGNAEPGSVDRSSVLEFPQKPPFSFYVEKANRSKHRDMLPLPFGHPKSRQWTEMLPSIKACTKDIMGEGNGGALELFVLDGEPTICVTCWHPFKMNLALLKSCMEPLELHINIAQGRIRKSAGDEHGNAVAVNSGPCSLPSIHGHYMQRPTCGASLGIAQGPLKNGKVSLGGYLKIKHLHRREWSYYAMTAHHILVDNNHASQCGDNDEDQGMSEAGYDYLPGICNGVYSVGEELTKKIVFSSPAVPDAENLVSRLESRRILRCANESYASIDNLDNLDTLLNLVCTSNSTTFGSAAWSSGLCLDQGVEMDWLLIGDIPVGRIGCNTPGDVTAYMEGNHKDLDQFQNRWAPSAHVDERAFDILMDFSTREPDKPESRSGYLSRIFGRGSETGLADGFLSPHSSVFYDPEYGPYDGWAFSPRYQYGLGDSGDSGTWIFTTEGKLLGQIISYNRERHVTYYTPISKVFSHIKRVTGATDVELLKPDDVPDRRRTTLRSAHGLLTPDEKSPNANDSST
ncbi:MAG: hypothetical protein M1830_005503, partial [Pleopsidium flavum]